MDDTTHFMAKSGEDFKFLTGFRIYNTEGDAEPVYEADAEPMELFSNSGAAAFTAGVVTLVAAALSF